MKGNLPLFPKGPDERKKKKRGQGVVTANPD
jgi:hypothetical protein